MSSPPKTPARAATSAGRRPPADEREDHLPGSRNIVARGTQPASPKEVQTVGSLLQRLRPEEGAAFIEVLRVVHLATADQPWTLLVDPGALPVFLADPFTEHLIAATREDQVPHPVGDDVKSLAVQHLVDDSEPIAISQQRETLLRRGVQAVINGTTWLNAAELSARSPKPPKNPHSQPSRWVEQGRLFALAWRGERRYPAYAVNELGEPIEALRAVLEVFSGMDGYRIAAWFESTNTFLNGARPRERIALRGQDVLAAAKEHALGPVHA